MGGGLVDSTLPGDGAEEQDTTALISYTKVFEQHFPLYLAIGMSYDEFYNKDCTLVKAYREAEEIKKRKINQWIWWMGAHVYEAVAEVSPILHDFVRPGTVPLPYASEPHPFTKSEVENKQKKDEEQRYKRITEYMVQHANQSINSAAKEGGNGRSRN